MIALSLLSNAEKSPSAHCVDAHCRKTRSYYEETAALDTIRKSFHKWTHMLHRSFVAIYCIIKQYTHLQYLDFLMTKNTIW